MKKIILMILLISGVCFGQYAQTTIASGAAQSSAVYVPITKNLVSVTVDTAFTDSNIGFLRYNSKLGKWCEVRDNSGIIEYTVGAITVPTTFFIKEDHSYLLQDSIKIVSQVSNVDSLQGQSVSIIYQLK